jgi:hypothetical protein
MLEFKHNPKADVGSPYRAKMRSAEDGVTGAKARRSSCALPASLQQLRKTISHLPKSRGRISARPSWHISSLPIG